jgi:hypothetical protein
VLFFLFCWLCFLFFLVAAFAFVSWRGVFLFCCDSPAIWVGLFVPSWTVRPTFDLGGAFAENGKGKGARARGACLKIEIYEEQRKRGRGGGYMYISEAKKSAAVDFADFWCVLSRSVFGAWAGGPARAPGVL